MAIHPDLAAEQAYIDRAYDCLEQARTSANRLKGMVEVGKGGTEQARFEREVIFDTVLNRLTQLQLGDASLLFGRIDREQEDGGDTFYIGRMAVSDERQEPVVVDWRAPVAEPFYRATGRQPMGLARRRYFATRGRQLLGIEDELFGEHALDLGEGAGLQGQGTLIAALETARSGRMGDIVATIQGEQDEIIRAPLPGVLVVQGGPGTGKTVVALHRAAYLLYTHRFPLEDQGVLVVGPNRLFLAYIEQVLPSLGEAGVELAVLADLVDGVKIKGRDHEAVARLKGDEVMAKVLAKAVRDRKRALRRPLRIGLGLQTLSLSVAGPRPTSCATPGVATATTTPVGASSSSEVAFHLAESSRTPLDPDEVWRQVRKHPDVRAALEEMWPVLTPAQLLHDLFGSKALLYLAAGRLLPKAADRAAAPAALGVGRRRGVDPRRRAPARRGPRPARPEAAPAAPRRRRDPDLRPHRDRRGAGPLTDAAGDDQPPVAQRIAHRGGRHRPVHRGLGPRRLERDPVAAARPPPRPARAAHGGLPHPGSEHGPGRPGPGPLRAGPPAAALGAPGRPATAVRAGR